MAKNSTNRMIIRGSFASLSNNKPKIVIPKEIRKMLKFFFVIIFNSVIKSLIENIVR